MYIPQIHAADSSFSIVQFKKLLKAQTYIFLKNGNIDELYLSVYLKGSTHSLFPDR